RRKVTCVALGQPGPQADASLRESPGPVRQQLSQKVREQVAARSELLPPAPADLVSLDEQARCDELVQHGAGDVGYNLPLCQAGDDVPGSPHPAQAKTAPQQLAQRADGDDQAASGMRGQRWRWRAAEPQVRKSLVLDQRHLEFAGETRQPLPFLGRYQCTGGVVERGRDVNEPGLRPSQQLPDL